jgi:hypothetical protein
MILINCFPFCKILDVGSLFSSLLKFFLFPNLPLLSCSGIIIQIMTHPQLLEGLKEESQVEDNGKEKELGHAP